MKRAYIGIPGSGKTTKLLDDLQKLDKSKNIVAFVEESELKKFKRRLPDADFYTKHDDLDEILKAKHCDTLIVDTYPSIHANDAETELPDNILWVYSSIMEVANNFGILKDSIDILRKLDEETKSSKQCTIIDLV